MTGGRPGPFKNVSQPLVDYRVIPPGVYTKIV